MKKLPTHPAKRPRSLQGVLLWLSSTIILGGGLIAALISFRLAFSEARAIQDHQLHQLAVFAYENDLSPVVEIDPARRPKHPEHQLYIVRVAKDGSVPSMPASLPFVSRVSSLHRGFHSVPTDQGEYRLYVLPAPEGDRIIAAQETAPRDEIARDSSLRTLVPVLLMLPVLVLMTRFTIRHVFAPVHDLTHALDRLTDTNLTPLPATSLPRELTPFAVSINHLILRLHDALSLQRSFIASASHELRTPLATLSLQADDLLAHVPENNLGSKALAIKESVAKASRLVEQLLDQARLRAEVDLEMKEVDFSAIASSVVGDLYPHAAKKQIDLGADRIEPAIVMGNEFALYTMLRNLVENAIRYTPAGGTIDVRVTRAGQAADVEVLDTGPGIRTEDLGRIFDPFYRGTNNAEPGSGLGLSIVRSIASRHGATIILQNKSAESGPGLIARYRQSLVAAGSIRQRLPTDVISK